MAETVKTFSFARVLLSSGWASSVEIAVGQDGLITKVSKLAKGAEPEVKQPAIPAMPNAHSHVFQRAFAGKSERKGPQGDDFWAWREAIYRGAKAMTPERMQAIAAWGYAEMLKAGYGGVCEFHYLHHQAGGVPHGDPADMADAILKAARSSGIDLTLLPVLYQRSGFGQSAVTEAQTPFYNTDKQFSSLLQLIENRKKNEITGVALHSLRAVPEEVVREAANLFPKGPLHIHIAEQEAEVKACKKALGKRPVEWLLENAQLDSRWSLVHATHAEVSELEGIAAAGAAVVLCPTTEANLGDGVFALAPFLKRGGRFAIGSDSHVSIDPREELRLLEYTARLTEKRRAVFATEKDPHPGARLWKAAVAGGLRASGFKGVSGLQKGAPANIAVLDENSPVLAGSEGDALLDALVFSGQPSPVRDVMVRGKWRVKDYRHATEDQLRQAYLSAITALAP